MLGEKCGLRIPREAWGRKLLERKGPRILDQHHPMPKLLPRLPEPSFPEYDAIYAQCAPIVRAGLEQYVAPLMANLMRYPLPVGRALELACGSGAYAHSLAEQSTLEVLGVDLDPGAIRLAQEWYGHSPRLAYQVADATQLQCNGEFGLVYCMDSLHHFPDLDQILASASAALVPGGFLYLTDLFREATQHDAVAQRVREMRQRFGDAYLLQQARSGRLHPGADSIYNLRLLQTANSKLAAYAKQEIAQALRRAGFVDIHSAEAQGSEQVPAKVIFAAVKPPK